MLADHFAHYYTDNPESAKEAVDDDFDMAAEMARADAEADGMPDDFEEI